jgi:probable F420-dependent oxidoreductase
MRFGLTLPHYGFSLPNDQPISHERLLEWAGRAESLGFDSVWISDHFFYSFARYGLGERRFGSLEPLISLAAVAMSTERVRLGTLVLGAPFRHPSTLARMAASIDQLSAGRLDLGVGAGWFDEEFVAFGFPFGTVASRFDGLEETLRVLVALFRDQPATIDGSSVSLQGAELLPPPVQRPIPVWVGGKGGPRLLRLVARHAAGWNVVWRAAPADYAERIDVARRICEQEGRDPRTLRLSVGLYGLLGEDEGAARAAFERGRAGMPGGALDAETYESWCADTLSGSPDRVLERVAAFEELGVEELILSPWVLPFAIREPEQVDLFARHVIDPLRG